MDIDAIKTKKGKNREYIRNEESEKFHQKGPQTVADPFFVQKYILFFLALASSVFYLQMTLTTALCH